MGLCFCKGTSSEEEPKPRFYRRWMADGRQEAAQLRFERVLAACTRRERAQRVQGPAAQAPGPAPRGPGPAQRPAQGQDPRPAPRPVPRPAPRPAPRPEPRDPESVPHSPRTPGSPSDAARVRKCVDPDFVDELVMETLSVLAAFVDHTSFTDHETPVSLVELHMVADSEEGWMQVVVSMINMIPLEDAFGASAISILLDECPLPSKESVMHVIHTYELCAERANAPDADLQTERNVCVVLGCVAEKMAGLNSTSLLEPGTLDYLLACLHHESACLVLFSLIALEKFASTTENRLTIKARLEAVNPHRLIVLEQLAGHADLEWRQVGFCAQWMLDNIFVIPDRTLTYEMVENTDVNALLNASDTSEYLKISSDGLEARCDSHSFESVRCTFQVDSGIWFYECTVYTGGVMQIGWATKNSHYLNHDGLGIGDDVYSVSFDGCRRLVWHAAHPTFTNLPQWRPGDVLGTLLDLCSRKVVFYLNGVPTVHAGDVFDTTRNGFYAAASFMAYQHCRFNFGREPFVYPPEVEFQTFNAHGELTDEQRLILPRRLRLERIRAMPTNDDACPICCDRVAELKLIPCGHGEFCSICTSQLHECPMCRGPISLISVKGHLGPAPAPAAAAAAAAAATAAAEAEANGEPVAGPANA